MANVLTPKFRVSYPNVFQPKFNELSKKNEYSLVALFPKGADLSMLKLAAQAAIEEKWGKDKKKWPPNLRTPFRDQGDRAKTDEETGKEFLPAGYEKGNAYLNLKSTSRPGLVDENVEEIIDSSQFYAGCWARATVSVYAYDQAGNKGVNFGLQNIQKVAEGDALSGKTKAQDDFAPIEGGAESASDLLG
jgi:hypothetical protein